MIEFRDLSDQSLRRTILALATAGGRRYIGYAHESNPPCWVESIGEGPWVRSNAMPAARQMLQVFLLHEAARLGVSEPFCDAVERCWMIEGSLEYSERIGGLKCPWS